MTERVFAARLQEGLTALQIELDREALARLYSYFSLLRKWSGKINLIARDSSSEQIIETHFLDSLTLLPLLPASGGHLLDIGTGAGFPGMVLKAAMPSLAVTLVEPRLKRVSFLKNLARTLGLSGTTILACRAEDEAMLPTDSGFTHITSRAVTDIGGFLAMAARFAAPAVEVICMKGPKWKEELAAAEQTIADLAYRQAAVHTATLPFGGAERVLLVFTRNESGSLR